MVSPIHCVGRSLGASVPWVREGKERETMERKIKLTFAYEGTAYCGLQFQKNGPSVQESMEKVLKRVLNEPVKLIASGRTDSGVHAKGQVAHIVTRSSVPAERLPHAMNTYLPHDIVVWSAEEMPIDFHARYHVSREDLSLPYSSSNLPRPLFAKLGVAL